MPNIIKNFLNTMRFPDDDEDYEDYLDDETEKEERKLKKTDRRTSRRDSEEEPQKNQLPTSNGKNDYKKERTTKMERNSVSKVVPIRSSSRGLEVCIMKPTTFEDSQVICDMLLTGKATVINLEGFDDKLAQRTMDFISGSVYAINGKLHRISSCIFIVSPDTVDISGDYLDIIQQNGFEPPTIHTSF